MRVERVETPKGCPPVMPAPVGPFRPGYCCAVTGGTRDRPEYCGRPAMGQRPTVGWRAHSGGVCFRCAGHRAEEEARGVRFDGINVQDLDPEERQRVWDQTGPW